MNTDCELQVTNVLADDFRIIADAIGNVQSRVRPDALAAAPTHEAMQQTFMLLPQRDS
jgi:hypothetical protein